MERKQEAEIEKHGVATSMRNASSRN